MKILIFFVCCFCFAIRADSFPDKSVHWGYKVIYHPKLKSEEVQALRKHLKAKEVGVLYPPEKNWKLPTGFLSVSSFLQEEEIKSLSASILKVESAEKTHQLKITMQSGLNPKENKQALTIFQIHKIQVIAREEKEGVVNFTVKTTLGADQVTGIPELGELIKWCTREDSNHRPSDS